MIEYVCERCGNKFVSVRDLMDWVIIECDSCGYKDTIQKDYDEEEIQ